jgi:hypothetical protein
VRGLFLVGLALLTGCAHGTPLFGRSSACPAPSTTDSLYLSAVRNLDPSNRNGTLDAAIANLDAYLSSTVPLKHAAEANALRSLARNSQQLARMEAALQQARASAADKADKADKPESRGRDDDALKEIQRLKDELAKANAELERIKKRLASPEKP